MKRLSGAEIRVTEIRQASKIWPESLSERPRPTLVCYEGLPQVSIKPIEFYGPTSSKKILRQKILVLLHQFF
jgi:hypothetical protein